MPPKTQPLFQQPTPQFTNAREIHNLALTSSSKAFSMSSSRSTPSQASSGAAGLLKRQLKYMQDAKDLPGISCGLVDDNVFEWEVMLMISDDCKYYGGTLILPISFSSNVTLSSSTYTNYPTSLPQGASSAAFSPSHPTILSLRRP